mmetsp:Transcript_11369/g.30610  ORF Transcript_11369/g.30610 Transcript_11369/m.30610 type:complete len:430 (+) Transcript_11369:278-1567(+)
MRPQVQLHSRAVMRSQLHGRVVETRPHSLLKFMIATICVITAVCAMLTWPAIDSTDTQTIKVNQVQSESGIAKARNIANESAVISQPPTPNPSSEPPTEFGELVKVAKRQLQSLDVISDRPETKYLFVSMGNKAFAPFYQSWYCNVKHMAGVHQRTLIIMSASNDAEDLQKMCPRINVWGRKRRPTPIGVEEDNLDYNTCGYWRIVQKRVASIGALLRAGITLVLWEPDAVWVQNPLEDDLLNTDEYDIIGFDDGVHVGFGWIRLRAIDSVVHLWGDLETAFEAEIAKATHKPAHQMCGEVTGEQNIFTELLKISGIKHKVLSSQKYVNGKWYDGGRGGDGLQYRGDIKAQGLPYVVNNNWIVGNIPKIMRAKRWGHWFAEEDGTCGDGVLQEKIAVMLRSFDLLAPPYGPPQAAECAPDPIQGACQHS